MALDAGEAAVTYLPPGLAEHSDRWLAGERCLLVGEQATWVAQDDPRWLAHLARVRQRGALERPPPDPERSAREASRRATKTTRLLAKVNRTDRLATLTYGGGGQHGWVSCWQDFRAFRRRAEQQWPGLATVAFIEPHPSGHGWHVHLLANRYLHKATLGILWGHGWVDIRRGRGRNGRLSSGQMAGYCAKYIAKTTDPEYAAAVNVTPRRLGQHRYRADGCLDPLIIRARFRDAGEARKWLRDWMPGRPEFVAPFAVEGTSISGYVLRWGERWWYERVPYSELTPAQQANACPECTPGAPPG